MAKPPPSAVDNVVSLAKRRGFVYPCGEIYGGTRSAWDYGPLGVELKDNIKRQWWRSMVQSREDVVGLDSSVILPRQTWEASGHVATFTDPLTECQSCHKRFRADHLQEEYAEKKGIDDPDDVDLDDPGLPQLRHPRRLDRAAPVLRPAQDLPRRARGRERPALPAPRDRAGHLPELRQRGDQRAQEAAVRHRPDRQELPQRDHARATSSSAPASSSRWRWSSSSSRARTRSGTSTGSTSAPAGTPTSASTPTTCATTSTPKEKLSHYSKRTVDIEYRFDFAGSEWGELEGIANRTDFDLKTHSEHSGQDLSYFDQAAERALPALRHRAGGRAEPQPDDLPGRRVDRGRGAQHQGRRRQAHRAQARPAPGAGQGRRAAAEPQRGPDPEGEGPGRRAARALERRLRRLGRDRSPLPPPGRDRHAVLRHRRLRHPRRRRRHGARARHDEAGADPARGRARPGSPSAWSGAEPAPRVRTARFGGSANAHERSRPAGTMSA